MPCWLRMVAVARPDPLHVQDDSPAGPFVQFLAFNPVTGVWRGSILVVLGCLDADDDPNPGLTVEDQGAHLSVSFVSCHSLHKPRRHELRLTSHEAQLIFSVSARQAAAPVLQDTSTGFPDQTCQPQDLLVFRLHGAACQNLYNLYQQTLAAALVLQGTERSLHGDDWRRASQTGPAGGGTSPSPWGRSSAAYPTKSASLRAPRASRTARAPLLSGCGKLARQPQLCRACAKCQ